MAFDPLPTSWLPNYPSQTTGQLKLSLTDFPELTDAEANTGTGDIRKIAYALVEGLYQSYLDIATADRPGKMTIQRNSSINDQTGVMTRTYTLQFKLTTSGTEVESE